MRNNIERVNPKRKYISLDLIYSYKKIRTSKVHTCISISIYYGINSVSNFVGT